MAGNSIIILFLSLLRDWEKYIMIAGAKDEIIIKIR
jgi:hypothetical protein